MFNNSKYVHWYNSIISRAKDRIILEYKEKHHIIPKCLGGNNSTDNLVYLTAREHFICHRLLVKMVDDRKAKAKLSYAAWQQSRSVKELRKISSRTYDTLRKSLSETYKGRIREPFSEEWKANMSKSHIGVHRDKHTRETKRKISEKKKGKKLGVENPFFGKTHSEEFKRKKSKATKLLFMGIPKIRVCCILCRKESTVNAIGRHYTKCQEKLTTIADIRLVPLANVEANIPPD